MGFFKKATFAAVLSATALTAATPAMARPYDHNRSDNTAGAAIVGGVIGMALGAIIASSGNDRDQYRRDDYRNRYQNRGWTWRNGHYYDRQGHRYDRNGRHDDRYYARRGYGDRGYYGDRNYYGSRYGY